MMRGIRSRGVGEASGSQGNYFEDCEVLIDALWFES